MVDKLKDGSRRKQGNGAEKEQKRKNAKQTERKLDLNGRETKHLRNGMAKLGGNEIDISLVDFERKRDGKRKK